MRRLDEVTSTNEIGKNLEWGWLSFYSDLNYSKVMDGLDTSILVLSVEDRDARRFELKQSLKDFGPSTKLK